ncbi:MAG: CotH kinase family protein [Bacteroidia bacterium]
MSPSRSLLLLLCITFLIPFLSKAQTGIDHWETAVFNDDTWSYRVGTSAPPANWMQPQFDASTWPTGPGGFGYGDGDDNTTIPTTLSVCIRIQFDIADTSKITMALLHADYDDAFVAYLNGTEIARENAGPTGTVLDFDDIPPTDHEATLYQGIAPEVFPIYPQVFHQLIRKGENTLAIQINNFLISSSDLSSNFFLSLGINDNSRDFEPTPSWFYLPFISTHLPLISINTNGQIIQNEPRIAANLKVVDNGSGVDNYVFHPGTDYDGPITIEIRGASSQAFDKKNYAFETQDQNGENNNVSLLGMPDENDWILHGPYSDKSLMRNALTYQIGRDVMDYASRTRFCELVIDGDYRGIYVLMEKIKRDKNRVNIAKLQPTDTTGDELTGGYIFQIDRNDPNIKEDGWYSPYGSNHYFVYQSPNHDQIVPAQKDYIRTWMTGFETAMNEPDYASTFDNYIDEASFVDYFLITELTKHIDAFKLSFYMYKRKDSKGGKLHMGPIWDYNLGYGNFNYACRPDPAGWIYPCTSRAFWLDKIAEIPAVQDRMYCRWTELRQRELSNATLLNRIDDMVEELGPAVDRNFDRFNILGINVWPNSFVGKTHEAEIVFLKSWVRERLRWMDDNMFGDPTTDCATLISIPKEDLPKHLTVHPNPFQDQVVFTMNDAGMRDGEVFIYDLQGKLLTRIKPLQQPILDLSALPSGMYFYGYRNGQEVLQAGKLVKR